MTTTIDVPAGGDFRLAGLTIKVDQVTPSRVTLAIAVRRGVKITRGEKPRPKGGEARA